MNTLSLSPALAALASAGHDRLIRLSDPAPELVGQRVAIWADEIEPEGDYDIGDWRVTFRPDVSFDNAGEEVVIPGRWLVMNMSEDVVHPDDSPVIPLHPGHIVGSARITDVLPVRFLCAGGPHLLITDGLYRCNGDSMLIDLSDQLPFLPGLKPGDHITVLADAARCEDRCPRCGGTGNEWRPDALSDWDAEHGFACPTCGVGAPAIRSPIPAHAALTAKVPAASKNRGRAA